MSVVLGDLSLRQHHLLPGQLQQLSTFAVISYPRQSSLLISQWFFQNINQETTIPLPLLIRTCKTYGLPTPLNLIPINLPLTLLRLWWSPFFSFFRCKAAKLIPASEVLQFWFALPANFFPSLSFKLLLKCRFLEACSDYLKQPITT
jgi:hypothetical protein